MQEIKDVEAPTSRENGFAHNSPSLLIVDDHTMILEVMSDYMQSKSGIPTQTAKSLDDARNLIAGQGTFDVILLDLHLPSVSGLAALKELLILNRGKPVAIFTGSVSMPAQTDILNAGAAGIILKTSALRTVVNAIRFIHAGERYVAANLHTQKPEYLTSVFGDLGQITFTPKELAVLQQLARGLSNRMIGVEMMQAETTVKMHVASICRKLNVKNRTHAVVLAKSLGLA